MVKLNLTIVAIVLSCIAIVLSIAQPTINFFSSMTQVGKPSFSISVMDFYVFTAFTRITIRNNGTATAHNVWVNLIFFAPTLPNWEATETIPEISASASIEIEIPIGRFQLESTVPEGPWFYNATSYEAYIHVKCEESIPTASFHFEHFIT